MILSRSGHQFQFIRFSFHRFDQSIGFFQFIIFTQIISFTRSSGYQSVVHQFIGLQVHRFTVSRCQGFSVFSFQSHSLFCFHQFSSILSQFFISSPAHQLIRFWFSSFSGQKFSVSSHFSFPVSVFQVFSFHLFIGFPAFSLPTGQFSVLHSHVSGLSFTVSSNQFVSSSIVSFHFSTSPQSVKFFSFSVYCRFSYQFHQCFVLSSYQRSVVQFIFKCTTIKFKLARSQLSLADFNLAVNF